MIRLAGTYPAVATPFLEGEVDRDALCRLAAHLVANEVDGLVACGTTGEAPTLTDAEWAAVVADCVQVAGELPVIAGTGTNSTAATIARTQRAAELGAAAALVVTPYYNKPTPRGLAAHYRAVSREGGLPVVLYNVPGRTGVNMPLELVAELAEEENIVAIKDAAGSVERFAWLVENTPDRFAILSGDDALCFNLYALGGDGTISTTATAAPRAMSRLYRAVEAGNLTAGRRIHYALLPLFAALFAETNPTPLKYALSLQGFGANELRLPLVPVTEATERQVRRALESLDQLSLPERTP